MRFPRRLKVEIDIPEELRSARVPGLLLQPLVENVIKYAVSGSRDKVTLTISAAVIDSTQAATVVKQLAPAVDTFVRQLPAGFVSPQSSRM